MTARRRLPPIGLFLALAAAAPGCGAPRRAAQDGPTAAGDAGGGAIEVAGRGDAGPGPLSLDAAREAHRRAELRRHLQYLEAASPGYLLRSTAERVSGERIERGAVSLAELEEVGRLLFEHEYTFADGLGSGHSRGEGARSPFRRVHEGRSGGPETTSCGSCHWRGGLAGAGGLPDASFLYGDGDRVDSADARNPPPLQGVGVVEALAREMSEELQAARDRLIEEARRSGRPAEGAVSAKGIRFGLLRASPDGVVDPRGLEGVDADLVVKPFGWKGTFATIREFLSESLQVHFGIQSEDAVARHRRRPDPELLGRGSDAEDPDGDGVRRELTSGQLTALVSFLALLELPVVRPPEAVSGLKPAAPGLLAPTGTGLLDSWARGRQVFEETGCSGCHTPVLVLRSPIFETRPETGGKAIRIDLSREGEPPRLRHDPALGGYPVWLFSDLKRHDLGEETAARHVDHGVAPRDYLTRRLWGLASSSPYLYDGRASSLDQAIAAHGGEAAAASAAFAELPAGDRAALRIYLLSLRRERRLIVP